MTNAFDTQQRGALVVAPFATHTGGGATAHEHLFFSGFAPVITDVIASADITFPTAAPEIAATVAPRTTAQDGVLGFVVGMVCLTCFLTLLATFAATSG